ncbi:MAG: TonB-dependent receptor, partial [Ginsengibacter sp.]
FKKVVLSILIFINTAVNSQSIDGKISDAKFNVVSGALVHLLNTQIATVSDTGGNFAIKNLQTGVYEAVISAEGCATKNLPITVTHKDINLSIQLTGNTVRLDEVIVTAEKKEENVQHVPVSVSELSAKNINDYRLWNSKDLTAVIPNLYAGNPGDGRNVTSIRGITSSSYDPAITTYIDGVNQFTLDTYIPQLFDVERIEVLRGPQGTLYGRNAMGGVINIITKQPPNKTEGFAEISMGNFGQQRYSAGFRTPITKDKLFLGMSALYEGMNGYYINEYTNSKFDKQHSTGGNYYLKYLASARWSLTANVKFLANRNYGSFPLAGSVEDAFAHPFVLNQNAVAKLVDNTFNTSLSANYSGRHFNFVSQTAYQSNYRYYATPIDGDFSPIDGVTVINNYGNKWNNVKVFTQELKFSSPAPSSSALKWTAGTYLFYQNSPNKQATHFGKDAQLVGSPDTNYAIINTTKLKTTGYAFYVQAKLKINKETDLIAGIRYDYQHTKEDVLGEYQPDTSPSQLFQTRPDTSATAHYSAFSPMLSIAWQPVSNTFFFVTYSRGYRTGGLTQLAVDPSQPPLYAYKPEYSNNFEVGSKNTFFNHHLRFNCTLFYTVITNSQVPTLILPDAITVTKNAGRLNSKGFDIEMASIPLKGLEATYNFGYTNAKYKTLKLSENNQEVDLAGKHQIFTPHVTSMLALQFTTPVDRSKTVKFIVRVEWSYLGKSYFDLNNSIHQSPYSLLNSRIGITTKYVDIMFWGRNLGNKKYIDYAYDFGAVHLGNPKTYGITLKIKL